MLVIGEESKELNLELSGSISDLSDLELWETRWIETTKELSQWSTLLDVAQNQNMSSLALECASIRCDWETTKKLRSSPSVVALLECGSLPIKLVDIMLSVIDNKNQEVERMCAQSVQLAMSHWAFLPPLCTGSAAHCKILHTFHRIIELRESAGTLSMYLLSLCRYRANRYCHSSLQRL
jgi:hypothetical protein